MELIDRPTVEFASVTRSQTPAAQIRSSFLKTIALQFAILAAAVGAVLAYRRTMSFEDLLVLAGVVVAIAKPVRCGMAFGFIVLWMAAYPPLSLPTYWVSLAPLAWMWQRRSHVSIARCSLESIAVGFAAAWYSTPFVRDSIPTWGNVAHGFGCLLFGCQLVPLGLCARWVHNWPPLQRALICAFVGVGCEIVQAHYGVAWSVMSLSLPAAPAPVAQWAHFLTQFGVSGIFYVCGFLLVPAWGRTGWRRWFSLMSAVFVIAFASAGGLWFRSQVASEPLGFSAMIVQPHWRLQHGSSPDLCVILDQLTRSELNAQEPVDLVVWPECSLAPSSQDNHQSERQSPGAPLSLQAFAWKVRREYGAAGLAGVVLWKQETEIKYGLPVLNRRAYNCACLVSPSGTTARQEKLALVPLKEGLPEWLEQPWVRNHVLPFFGFSAFLSPGDHLQLLALTRRDGRKASVIVPICYESFLPWLPHYHESGQADAIIHLTYDGDFADRPEYATLEIWACQYRAIETRKWNLVCATWAGSAIIDPAGRVVARLGSCPGVLRTNTIEGVEPLARNSYHEALRCRKQLVADSR